MSGERLKLQMLASATDRWTAAAEGRRGCRPHCREDKRQAREFGCVCGCDAWEYDVLVWLVEEGGGLLAVNVTWVCARLCVSVCVCVCVYSLEAPALRWRHGRRWKVCLDPPFLSLLDTHLDSAPACEAPLG